MIQTSVKIAVKDTKINKVVAEAYVQVVISNYDTSKLKLTSSKSSVTAYSGQKVDLTLTATNVPKGLNVIWNSSSGSNTVFKNVWGKGSTNNTTRTYGTSIYFLAPGSSTVTYSLKEKTTGTVLGSCTVNITTKNNLTYLTATDYTIDLAVSNEFSVGIASNNKPSTSFQDYYSKPSSMEFVNTSVNEYYAKWFNFKASKTGKFTIKLTRRFKVNDEYYDTETITFNITVIDSSNDPSKRTDNIILDKTEYRFDTSKAAEFEVKFFIMEPYAYTDYSGVTMYYEDEYVKSNKFSSYDYDGKVNGKNPYAYYKASISPVQLGETVLTLKPQLEDGTVI